MYDGWWYQMKPFYFLQNNTDDKIKFCISLIKYHNISSRYWGSQGTPAGSIIIFLKSTNFDSKSLLYA